jgi:hypothetical protein
MEIHEDDYLINESIERPELANAISGIGAVKPPLKSRERLVLG